MDAFTSTLDTVRAYAGAFTWEPLIRFSRSTILRLLKRIAVGQLVVRDSDGLVTVCGSPQIKDGSPRTELRVLKETFWVRVLLFADMGFAESFMLGEFSCPDLVAFFQIFIFNRTLLSNATTLTSSIASTLTNLARSTNTLANSQLNVSAHYDISNAMFAAFLSEDMTYSCPMWSPLSDSSAAHEPLEDAQERKLQYFITQARIKESDHVLEIGTGWGSFAISAVKETGCRVTSLTLSREQKVLAEDRIKAAGLSEQIRVLLCDYRAMPAREKNTYDKIVSIEMLEAVGREYLETYFECINRLLKPKGGIAVFQCITMPENRYEAYSKGEDFIRKYIFPGGHLVPDAILNIGGHYAKTLRLWRQRFERNFNNRIRPALLEEHESMTEKDIELFRRKWQYYFTYCEAGFRSKTLGDVIITVGREGATEMLEEIPL